MRMLLKGGLLGRKTMALVRPKKNRNGIRIAGVDDDEIEDEVGNVVKGRVHSMKNKKIGKRKKGMRLKWVLMDYSKNWKN